MIPAITTALLSLIIINTNYSYASNGIPLANEGVSDEFCQALVRLKEETPSPTNHIPELIPHTLATFDAVELLLQRSGEDGEKILPHFYAIKEAFDGYVQRQEASLPILRNANFRLSKIISDYKLYAESVNHEDFLNLNVRPVTPQFLESCYKTQDTLWVVPYFTNSPELTRAQLNYLTANSVYPVPFCVPEEMFGCVGRPHYSKYDMHKFAEHDAHGHGPQYTYYEPTYTPGTQPEQHILDTWLQRLSLQQGLFMTLHHAMKLYQLTEGANHKKVECAYFQFTHESTAELPKLAEDNGSNSMADLFEFFKEACLNDITGWYTYFKTEKHVDDLIKGRNGGRLGLIIDAGYTLPSYTDWDSNAAEQPNPAILDETKEAFADLAEWFYTTLSPFIETSTETSS